MAEPTCVIHPISYTSPAFSTGTLQEENPGCIYGVEESVSFGRFMSENLSWERWSSFNTNRNRYVEEAEKYSRPGSVAQKKAYFEAHFKRMAALKAAALLEQDANGGTGPETGVPNESGSSHGAKNLGVKAQILAHNNTNEGGGSNEGVEGFVVHQNELYSVVPGNDEELSETKDVEVVKTATPPPGPPPPPPPGGPPPPPPQPPSVGLALAESGETAVDDKRMLEQSEVKVMKDEDWNGIQKELSCNGIVQMEKSTLQKANLKKEEMAAPIVKKNPSLSSFISPADGIGNGKGAAPLFSPSPAKSTASVHPGKENYATPMKKNSSSITDPHKKRTPLRASLNREFNRILSPVIRKIGSSSKTSKDCSTPVRTPSKGSMNGAPEPPPLLTPNATREGVRSHHDSSTGHRKPASPRWHILSEGLKSPNNKRNKTSSPIIPTSFCLRSRERAQQRKQKLEDKFNATTTEKAPQPSKFKEKAEAELNKFRQSFCFKVMSSSDHYTEAEFQNKNESTKRAGRQANASTFQSSSLPPRRPTVKASSLKNVNGRNSSSSHANV